VDSLPPPIPKDPAFQARIQASFDKQGLMRTLGASILRIEPGAVEIVLPASPAVSQQHGFVHAGAVSAIADSAAGYAALTLMPPDAGVLTTEFKINLVAPTAGERLLARGCVIKAGRTPDPGSGGGLRRDRGAGEAGRLPDRHPDGDRGPRRGCGLGRRTPAWTWAHRGR
jgi:uncharacterized protein (TIGR00369 family)